MRKRNLDIDFIQIPANIIDGEFIEWVHHSLFDLGKVVLAQIISSTFLFSPKTLLVMPFAAICENLYTKGTPTLL